MKINNILLNSLNTVDIALLGRFNLYEIFEFKKVYKKIVNSFHHHLYLKHGSKVMLFYSFEYLFKKLLINPASTLKNIIFSLINLDYSESDAVFIACAYLIFPLGYNIRVHPYIILEKQMYPSITATISDDEFIKKTINKNIITDFARILSSDFSLDLLHSRLIMGKKDSLRSKSLLLMGGDMDMETVENNNDLYLRKVVSEKKYFCGQFSNQPIDKEVNYFDGIIL